MLPKSHQILKEDLNKNMVINSVLYFLLVSNMLFKLFKKFPTLKESGPITKWLIYNLEVIKDSPRWNFSPF